MIPDERTAKILEYININGSAYVDELAELVGVSESTIRRDLKKLSDEQLIVRSHGGAVKKGMSTSFEEPTDSKIHLQQKEKNRIANFAKKYVVDGHSIFLDSGTTLLAFSKGLKTKEKLTVITYDLRIALQTELSKDSTMIVTGGVRRDEFDVLVGSNTVKMIDTFTVDKAFLGVDAIDLKKGITNASFHEVEIKKGIIKAAREVIVLADYTKFNKSALIEVAPLAEIDFIITDDKIDEKIVEKYREAGVRILVAD